MSTGELFPSSPLAEWKTESLRLTIFPGKLPDRSAAFSWWKEVVGGEPESVFELPRSSKLQQEGSLGNGRLSLQVTPLRIDWVLSPYPTDEPSLAIIGPFEKEVSQFVDLLKGWLSKQQVQRIALGAILLIPVKEKKEGYQRLAKFIPNVKLDVDNMSDFSYRINRPRNSRIRSDLLLNRIQTWSVMLSKKAQFSFGAQPFAVLGPDFYACRLEMDLNTAADYLGILENPETLLEELKVLGEEIATRGDVL